MTHNTPNRLKPSVSRNPVENYVGFPIPEDLRRELEVFLNAHDDLEEERAFAEMLALGLALLIKKETGEDLHDEEIERSYRSIVASQNRLRVVLGI